MNFGQILILLTLTVALLAAMLAGLRWVDTGSACLKNPPAFLIGSKVDCEVP